MAFLGLNRNHCISSWKSKAFRLPSQASVPRLVKLDPSGHRRQGGGAAGPRRLREGALEKACGKDLFLVIVFCSMLSMWEDRRAFFEDPLPRLLQHPAPQTGRLKGDGTLQPGARDGAPEDGPGSWS